MRLTGCFSYFEDTETKYAVCIRDFGEVLFLGHANLKPRISFKSYLFNPKGQKGRKRDSLLTKQENSRRSAFSDASVYFTGRFWPPRSWTCKSHGTTFTCDAVIWLERLKQEGNITYLWVLKVLTQNNGIWKHADPSPSPALARKGAGKFIF